MKSTFLLFISGARISMEIYIFMGAIKEIGVKDSFYLLEIVTNILLQVCDVVLSHIVCIFASLDFTRMRKNLRFVCRPLIRSISSANIHRGRCLSVKSVCLMFRYKDRLK